MIHESIQGALQGHYLTVTAGILLLFLVGKCFYELYINPLHKIAGPKLAAITRLVHMYHSLMGDEHVWVRNLHLAFGDTVRISPDQVSYSCADGWRDIYGHASATKKSTEKDMRFFGTTLNGTPDVIRAKAADHSRFRRNFSHAFSDKALREQQPLIAHYADLLIEKLREVVQADPKAKIEMVLMYNLTTFDIMGDLTFGDPLNLLKGTGNVGWVTSIFSSVKINSLRRVARYYPWCSYFLNSLLPRSLKKRQASHYQSCKDRVDWRVDQSLDRPDIWGLVMSQKESLRLSREEMYANSQLFMVAGTETTATALSGLTYQLLLNPDKMEKITKEIRDAFERDSDIDMLRLAQLKYLNMCIDEGLRMYPPVPAGMPRLTPKEGMEICGEYMPGNTAVSVHHWATYRNPRNFTRPDDFLPERWSSDPQFAGDDKAAFQPFSFGPRNCLGKNLAYHEMRLILAKVLYHYDLNLASESVGWDKQNTWTLWQKNRLMVQLTPRV
ncbi:cytochrome P450 [Aspergillus eucalypticola CBS 122712]|uniref:Cytochrome P450 n=1 Tax=Aspergillus eucalypticola (strain CBS 122712 / IBT 29274) TaxID=1448314 RepID=A0A317VVN9_ASPEC|nr:cytochrome P450 [Aspergillus eucalypticola CBS 122712]PWY75960.1 cytochrome P450 [Aspergillus eucalypticola CBS 122712]